MSTAAQRIEAKLDQALAELAQLRAQLAGNQPTPDTRRPDVGTSIHPRTCACQGSGWIPADDPTMPGTTVAAECPGTDSDIAPIVTLADAKAHLDRVRATRRHPTNPQEPGA